MPLPICYLNGDYLALADARVSPLDRAFLFGDAVYEVLPVYAERPFRLREHLDRLTRSLSGIRMPPPLSHAEWGEICRQLIARNGGGDQYLYLQVTRGAEYGRNHAPLPDIPRTVFAFAAPLPVNSAAVLGQGVACITAADTRWARCDIKSTALLANVLLRQLAADSGATETLLLREGELTEACASSVHVVQAGSVLLPPNSHQILPGTTRSAIEELAAREGIPCRTTPVSEAQLRAADEIWLTAATRELQPVTRLDGHPVGSGRPGPLFTRMYAQLQRYKAQLAGTPW